MPSLLHQYVEACFAEIHRELKMEQLCLVSIIITARGFSMPFTVVRREGVSVFQCLNLCEDGVCMLFLAGMTSGTRA